ncbi:hypothetical protein [Butyrivibrio sp. INlla14]|uniref:hypothetical protein n=1 Tax=Butyrivibrio sp. INlla14 TaxID=1520808 RepID=UPI0008768360|nr:hypothetical protein [Butyrivibrio sp. INlla14]SCY13885.1 hypothetical protein SAMN02910371_01180 [Butyrivibrio sp. INlla14]
MITSVEFSKAKLRKALEKLFGMMDYDQLMCGVSEEDEDRYVEMDDEDIVEDMADNFADKLYPSILYGFREYIDDVEGRDATGRLVGDELFFEPAAKIYSAYNDYYGDHATEIFGGEEVYLLSDGDIILVDRVEVESGRTRLVYRRPVKKLESKGDFYINESKLFEWLALQAGEYIAEED